jgi:hypothetical protein
VCERYLSNKNFTNTTSDNLHVQNINGGFSPLNLTWLSYSDVESTYNVDLFTIVRSSKNKRNIGKTKCVVSSRPITRTQSRFRTATHAPGRSDKVGNPPDRYIYK